jgi:hypothetical protein
LIEDLYRLERYERRAFSALKTAARAFDRAPDDGLTLDELLSKIDETTAGGHDQNLTKRTQATVPTATGDRDESDKTNPPRHHGATRGRDDVGETNPPHLGIKKAGRSPPPFFGITNPSRNDSNAAAPAALGGRDESDKTNPPRRHGATRARDDVGETNPPHLGIKKAGRLPPSFFGKTNPNRDRLGRTKPN